MAGLVVLLIILGCGAFQFLKGTIFKATLTMIAAIIAFAVAFGYFEPAGGWLVGKISNDAYKAWAQPLCFVIIFVLSFAVLQTAAMQWAKKEVDFGDLPERIGRPILGIFLGLIVSGFALTALAMAPLPNKYPYQRFDARNPDNKRPEKVLLNVDGFVCGWFGILSNGSMRAIRGPQSFSSLHPDFLDQLYLNRHNDSDDIPLIAKDGAVSLPSKEGVWHASGTLKDSEGNPITPETGCGIMVVRIAFSRNYVSSAGKFTLGQLRLICLPRDSSQGALTGKGVNAYSIGYFSRENEITKKRLGELITVKASDYADTESKKDIDFAFNVPNDYVPVALQFKQNVIAQVSRAVSSEQAPAVSPFSEKSTAAPTAPTPADTDSNEVYTRPGANRSSSSNDSRGGRLSPAGEFLTGGVTDEQLNQ